MTLAGKCLCGQTQVNLEADKPDGVILCHWSVAEAGKLIYLVSFARANADGGLLFVC